MTISELKVLSQIAKEAGLTPAELQDIALKTGVKSSNDLLILAENISDGKRAASFINN